MKVSSELEKQAAHHIAALMAAAARTAPKTRGVDNIQVVAIDDQIAKQNLVDKMKEIARSENRPSFARDADSILASPVIVVIGVLSNPAGLNCGFCGNPTCDSLRIRTEFAASTPWTWALRLARRQRLRPTSTWITE